MADRINAVEMTEPESEQLRDSMEWHETLEELQREASQVIRTSGGAIQISNTGSVTVTPQDFNPKRERR
jgi:hypothetical protein